MSPSEFRLLWRQAFRYRAEVPEVIDHQCALEPRHVLVERNVDLGAAFLGIKHDRGGVVLALGPVPLVQISRGLRRVDPTGLHGQDGFGHRKPLILDMPKRVIGAWVGNVGAAGGLARFRAYEAGYPMIDILLSPAFHDVLGELVGGDHPLANLIRQMDEAVPRSVE